MKKGFVLIVSVIILISLTAIAAAFISMLSVRTRAARALQDSAKAFWLAEAGIQQVAYKLKTDANYRNNPANISGSLGGGTYAVTVVKRANQTIYDTTSVGTSGSMSRTITQVETVTVGGWIKQFTDYGAFSSYGGVSLENNSSITGDVYTMGTVATAKNAYVSGIVYANSGSGNYTRMPLPSPPLTFPSFDASYYNAQINTAKSYPAGNQTYSNISLAGTTLYVNGTATATNITGPGTIVSTGNFTIGSGTIGPDVKIITNTTLSFSKNAHVLSGAVLYATGNVTVSNPGVIVDNAALLTPGSVAVSGNLSYNGVIFCGSDFNSTSGSQSMTITGALVSGGVISMSKSDRIVQNSALLPVSIPAGLESGGSTTTVTLSDWSG